jgi:hypothetical protein
MYRSLAVNRKVDWNEQILERGGLKAIVAAGCSGPSQSACPINLRPGRAAKRANAVLPNASNNSGLWPKVNVNEMIVQ